MIEQRDKQLVMTIPSAEAAAAFSQFLQTLLAPREPGTSAPSSELLQASGPLPPSSPPTDPPSPSDHVRNSLKENLRKPSFSRVRSSLSL